MTLQYRTAALPSVSDMMSGEAVQKTGGAKLVIGTRSAVFAPFENLGLIIIDEEQGDAISPENSPRYHARDVAKYRCAASNSLLLLGSATPDIESRYATERKV